MNVTESTHKAVTKQRCLEGGDKDKVDDPHRDPGVVHPRALTATGRLCTVGRRIVRPAAVFLD